MDKAFDERRFRSLGVAGVLLVTLGLNARAMYAAFLGHYSVEYVLGRYVAALFVGYIGLRIMESILFRRKDGSKGADESNNQNPAADSPVS